MGALAVSFGFAALIRPAPGGLLRRPRAAERQAREDLLKQVQKRAGSNYIDSIRQLERPGRAAGTARLQALVDTIVCCELERLPGI